MASTHSDRLERWLGPEVVRELSGNMRGWYGPPIAVDGVPGNVVVCGDGDFYGEIRAGWETSVKDRLEDTLRKLRARIRIATGPEARLRLNSGFATLAALLQNVPSMRYDWVFNKGPITFVGNQGASWWNVGVNPAAGSAPGNPAGGTVYSSTSTGAIPFTNPGGSFQTFYTGAISVASSRASTSILIYDLLFGVNKTMASTSTEAVTGVPTRYTNTTDRTFDSINGNFVFIQVGGTVLPSTAHNWTVCKYTNQTGATATFPSMAGVASAAVNTFDMPANTWFFPLATGDTGVGAITQLQCSASIATGVIWFMLGHPIAWIPCLSANVLTQVNGINTSFNLTRIFDSACIAFLNPSAAGAGGTTITGQFQTVAG